MKYCVKGVTAKDTGFIFETIKMFYHWPWWWLHISVNIWKPNELYTLNGYCILCELYLNKVVLRDGSIHIDLKFLNWSIVLKSISVLPVADKKAENVGWQ